MIEYFSSMPLYAQLVVGVLAYCVLIMCLVLRLRKTSVGLAEFWGTVLGVFTYAWGYPAAFYLLFVVVFQDRTFWEIVRIAVLAALPSAVSYLIFLQIKKRWLRTPRK